MKTEKIIRQSFYSLAYEMLAKSSVRMIQRLTALLLCNDKYTSSLQGVELTFKWNFKMIPCPAKDIRDPLLLKI